MSVHTITVRNRASQFQCSDQQSLLHGVESQRIKTVRVGCRGGGCGVCKIRVVSGEFRSKKMSIKHVTAQQQSQGYCLSCRIYPLSDMTIEALDESGPEI